jgi:pseudouridine-5'-phosphate glycosidase
MPFPKNVDVAKQVEAVVRAHGAVPATIAVVGGFPKVGLDATELELLGQREKYDVSLEILLFGPL